MIITIGLNLVDKHNLLSRKIEKKKLAIDYVLVSITEERG